MRLTPALIICLLTLSTGACSMFGGEKVQSDYVGTGSLDQSQVARMLAEKGYTNISGLHKNGQDWVGSAMNKDGQEVNFDIDKAGTIHTK